jgi:hypothetical protein
MIFEDDNFPIPSESDIKKAIEKSGYIFELELCPVFEKFDYITDSSSCFQDQDTAKTREIDIHAYQHHWIDERRHPKDHGLIISDLLRIDIIAECKNNRSGVIFFTREPYLGHIGNIILSGNPEYIKDGDEIAEEGLECLEDFLQFEEFHHNWKTTYPAYQFGLMKPKFIAKGSPKEIVNWSLSHEDYYDSINKLGKAAISKGSDIFKDSLGYDFNEFQISLIYPFLIFKDHLYECRTFQKSFIIQKVNHLTLQWNLMVSGEKFQLNIDVLCSAYLPQLLKIIKNEKEEVLKRIQLDLKKIRKNVSKNATSKFQLNR